MIFTSHASVLLLDKSLHSLNITRWPLLLHCITHIIRGFNIDSYFCQGDPMLYHMANMRFQANPKATKGPYSRLMIDSRFLKNHIWLIIGIFVSIQSSNSWFLGIQQITWTINSYNYSLKDLNSWFSKYQIKVYHFLRL